MVPCEASKILFGTSGSEANDMQIKPPGTTTTPGQAAKEEIISRMKGYHGATIASGSLTGLAPVHADFDSPIKGILDTSCRIFYRYSEEGESEDEFATRMANDLDEMIQREAPDTVAGFIAEPIMGAGGVIIRR